MNETFKQPIGTAKEKIALAVVSTAEKNGVEVEAAEAPKTEDAPAFKLDTASNPDAQNLPD